MKKGVSLTVLVLTIIIIVILVGVIVVNTQSIFIETDKTMLKVDIAQLETLMKTYNRRVSGNIDFETVEFSTSGMSSVTLSQFEGETIANNKISLYVINLAKIDAEGVNLGNLEKGAKDRYLYSASTGKVYYEMGLETDDGVYYYVKSSD